MVIFSYYSRSIINFTLLRSTLDCVNIQLILQIPCKFVLFLFYLDCGNIQLLLQIPCRFVLVLFYPGMWQYSVTSDHLYVCPCSVISWIVEIFSYYSRSLVNLSLFHSILDCCNIQLLLQITCIFVLGLL